MGAHSTGPPDRRPVRRRAPVPTQGPCARTVASPLLALLEPLNGERMTTFRELQARLSAAWELAAVIVDEAGAPMLQVVRVDNTRSMLVGLIYHAGDWWLTAGGIAFARASELDEAARIIWRAMCA